MYPEELVYTGILIGLSVSAPIGPIGVLCINRTVTSGITSGILTGLGAAIPNMIYAFLAVFGIIKLISPILHEYKWIVAVSGCYIIYLGLTTIMKRKSKKAELRSNSNFNSFITTFLIMITNPSTIIGFTFVLTAFGIAENSIEPFSGIILVLSVGAGAMIWWITLSVISSILGEKFIKDRIVILNRISGSVIVLFGFIILINSIT